MPSEALSVHKITDDLKIIKNQLEFIKEHMFDSDSVMTLKEERRFKQSLEELKAGKTIPLSKLKKELGL